MQPLAVLLNYPTFQELEDSVAGEDKQNNVHTLLHVQTSLLFDAQLL